MYILPLFLSAVVTAVPVYAQDFASTTTFAFSGSTLPTGLSVSTYKITEDRTNNPRAKYDRQFEAKNVEVSGGFMNLIVPGGQSSRPAPGPISCAEVVTDFVVSSASVKTYAILTDEAGVCNGMFVYANDNQESDIEWISDANSQTNIDANNGTRAILYTNQDTTGSGESTTAAGKAPGDATSAVHEYRLDWTADSTKFYLDGVLQYTFTQNVPTVAGPWIWNNWVNGDPYWTVGPPVNDAVFKIQKVVMFYNS